MKDFIKRLNWHGFLWVYCFSVLAAFFNQHTKSIIEHLILGQIFGIIFGTMFLFMGMKTKQDYNNERARKN